MKQHLTVFGLATERDPYSPYYSIEEQHRVNCENLDYCVFPNMIQHILEYPRDKMKCCMLCIKNVSVEAGVFWDWNLMYRFL